MGTMEVASALVSRSAVPSLTVSSLHLLRCVTFPLPGRGVSPYGLSLLCVCEVKSQGVSTAILWSQTVQAGGGRHSPLGCRALARQGPPPRRSSS